MFRLINGTQDYNWGSPNAIPRFLNEMPDGSPVAEVWMGTHPMNPSFAVLPDGGTVELTRVSGELPFMAKLLAAAQPLSLQVHPPKSIAEAGFLGEEAAGIPREAPHRSYRDRNHKPEMVYALSQFDSLIGFRPTSEILRVLNALDTDLAQRMLQQLRNNPGFSGIVEMVHSLLSSPPGVEDIAMMTEACSSLVARGVDIRRAYVTTTEIAKHYPDDIGTVIALLLNRVTLQPGEVAFLEPGIIHAHLSGLGVEVMATSDNVLRAGLTTKHVDPAGLISCLNQGMAGVARVTPEYSAAGTEIYSPPGLEFAMAITQVADAPNKEIPLIAAQESIILCTSGEVELRKNDCRIALKRGQSVFTACKDELVQVSGLGEVVQAYSPHPNAVHSRLVNML